MRASMQTHVWTRGTHLPILLGLLLVSLAQLSLSCDYNVAPSSGVAGIKDILATETAGQDLLICLTDGSYYASSASNTPVNPSRMDSVTIRGSSMDTTIVDLNDRGQFLYGATASDVTLEDLTVREADGSAVELYDAILTVKRVRFETNYAGFSYPAFGGAVYVTRTTTQIKACEFENNRGYDGGAIFTSYGDLTVEDSYFTANSAVTEGGAIYTQYTPATYTNTHFNANTAGNDAGDAVFVRSMTSTFYSSLITNSANMGLYLYEATGYLYDSAIADNGDRGVYCTSSGSVFYSYDSVICGQVTDVSCSQGNMAGHQATSCGAECTSELLCPKYHFADLPGTSTWTSCDAACDAFTDDECADGTHTCHPNATCTDTFDAYECDCSAGFYGDGYSSCIALVNECELPIGAANCSGNLTCVDTEASFVCDLDECAAGVHDCDTYEVCVDVADGSDDSFVCVDPTTSSVATTTTLGDVGALERGGGGEESTASAAILAAVLVPLALLLCCGFAVGGAALCAARTNHTTEPDMEMYSRARHATSGIPNIPVFQPPPKYSAGDSDSDVSVSRDSSTTSEVDSSSSSSGGPPPYSRHSVVL